MLNKETTFGMLEYIYIMGQTSICIT